MSFIEIKNLTFCYDGSIEPVFDGLSVSLDTDWRLGLTGRNGRGKTTLLKLLLGQYEYGGTIVSDAEFEYFPFPVSDMRAPASELAATLCPETPLWQLKRELSLLNMQEEALFRPFETLSNGERAKVLLALLFLKKNRFLLIDEPTNHLDLEARAAVGDYLAKKQGYILVSHDRAFLDRCVDHILALNKTGAELCRGSFSMWWENKQRRDESEREQNRRLKQDIDRLNNAARQSADWSSRAEKTKYATRNSGLRPDRGYIGHKSAKMMQRAKNLQTRRQDAAAQKSALLRDLETDEPLKLSPLTFSGARMAQLSNVGIYYGEKQACRGVSFAVTPGARIALCGKNGTGKSSVLKLLHGDALSFTGGFERSASLKVSYIPQSTDALYGCPADYAEQKGLDVSLLFTILRKLDFSRAQLMQQTADMSDGQKKKVLLAASLCERAHLYLWDEPLNYIDVLSRMQIERLLKECPLTLVFAEHDRAFCDNIATHRIML